MTKSCKDVSELWLCEEIAMSFLTTWTVCLSQCFLIKPYVIGLNLTQVCDQVLSSPFFILHFLFSCFSLFFFYISPLTLSDIHLSFISETGKNVQEIHSFLHCLKPLRQVFLFFLSIHYHIYTSPKMQLRNCTKYLAKILSEESNSLLLHQTLSYFH